MAAPAPVSVAVAQSPADVEKIKSKRAALVSAFRNREPFNGELRIGRSRVIVRNGLFVSEGVTYAVSKDVRCVMNTKTNLIIGEVVRGEIRAPSVAFLKEMEYLWD